MENNLELVEYKIEKSLTDVKNEVTLSYLIEVKNAICLFAQKFAY